MKNIILLAAFTFYLNSSFSQHCALQDSSFNLYQTLEHSKYCDTLTIIKHCLKFQKSKKPNSSLFNYIKNDTKGPVSEESKIYIRLERFASLFYIHNSLIQIDSVKKDFIILVIDGKFIYDNYMGNVSSYPAIGNDELIKCNLRESKKYNKEIKLYYKVMKKYVADYEQSGKIIAKQNYLSNLSKCKITWIYNWKEKR